MKIYFPFALSLVIVSSCDGQSQLAFQEEGYCIGAQDYLSETLGNLVLVEPDTMQDWRTQRTVPACRVYAAEATELTIDEAAQLFYDRLLDSGWSRTPDPHDMPNEAAIRLRFGDADCLYHIYKGPLIGTPAEIEVTSSVTVEPGEERYNVLVQCMPAAPAAPR